MCLKVIIFFTKICSWPLERLMLLPIPYHLSPNISFCIYPLHLPPTHTHLRTLIYIYTLTHKHKLAHTHTLVLHINSLPIDLFCLLSLLCCCGLLFFGGSQMKRDGFHILFHLIYEHYFWSTSSLTFPSFHPNSKL